MEVAVKSVHIGESIEKRRLELDISKSELGRRIGVSQQHVNRILKRDTMESKKLVDLCHALDFNFFTLFCEVPPQISAYLAAVTLHGDANNFIGDAQLIAELTAERAKAAQAEERVAELTEKVEMQKEYIESLKNNLEDKNAIIELLRKGQQ